MKQFITFVLLGFNSFFLWSQSFTDGPITIDVRLREVQGNFAGTDEALLGVGFAPDELTFKIWAKDNLNNYSWTGGNCNQDNNFTPTLGGTNSIDFNNTFANFSFPNAIVPQSLDFRIDAWEDDLPSDNLIGFCNTGTACSWENVICCGITLFGMCIGIETGDDYRCDANPFYQGLTYRSGPPCQWYSHGYINGTGCFNPSSDPNEPINTSGYYKPRIETFWRYTKGTSFANAIDLGLLTTGTPLTHFNSNECYTNYYPASSGNDVIYSFQVLNPTGVNISLCGANGAQFDSHLYLVYDTTAVAIANNDNFCNNQSEIVTPLCEVGTYYVVVDATLASELGTFTLMITEDVSSAFLINTTSTAVSCNGGNDGKIMATWSGGIAPFTFNWYDNNMMQIGLANTTNNNIDSLTSLIAGTYIYQIADGNNCTLTDTVLVIEPNVLVLNTNVTNTSCFGIADGTANASVISGGTAPFSFSWNSIPVQNNPSAVFLPAGNYQVLVTDFNGCTTSSSVLVTQPAAFPIAINSTANTICQGGSINLSASGANTYTWSPPIWLNNSIGQNVISTPNASISYILTGTDINGCSNTDTINITVVQSLALGVNPPSPTVCMGESISVTANGAVSYNWFPNTALNTNSGNVVQITPAVNTTYFVVGTDNFGCSDTTSFSVNVNSVPVVNVTSNPNICEGSTVALVASGTNNFTWFPSLGLNNTIGAVVTASPQVSTTYFVVGQDANGCKDTVNTTVSVIPNPVLTTIPQNTSVCVGDTAMLYVSGANTYIWSPNLSISSISTDTVSVFPVVSTTYNVVGIDGFGCSAVMSIPITVHPLPIISATPNSSICLGETIMLSANGALQYNWSPSGSLSSANGSSVGASPTNSTTYLITGTDANSCASTTSTFVNVLPLPILQLSPISSTICQGENIMLNVSGAANYLWSPAVGLNTVIGNSVIATLNSNTTYFVIGTDANNCSDMASVNIIVNPLPFVSVNPPIASICEGSSIMATAFGADTYVWSPPLGLNTSVGNNVVASPQFTTDYTIVGTDANNCSNTANLHIDVGVVPIITVNPLFPTICEGSSISLSASGANSFSWSPTYGLSAAAGSTVNANPLVSTIYNLVGTDNNGCADSVQIALNVNPLPTANILPTSGGTICSEDSALIIVQMTGNPPWNILHTINGTAQSNLNTSNNPLIIYSNTDGNYAIATVEDANGCANIGNGNANVQVLYSPYADFDFYPQPTTILEPNITFTNNSILAMNWIWEFGDGFSNTSLFSPSHEYLQVGTYPVTLVVFNGQCTDTATAQIIIDPVFTLYIPDVFTPNGDQLNDEFAPGGEGIESFEMVIFDRWGAELFRSDNILYRWDGTAQNNNIVPAGYYTYLINVEDALGVTHQFKGKLLLQK